MSDSPQLPLSQVSIVHETVIAAPPERVFNALTLNIASWWSHTTYKSNGKPNLRLEPTVGGRFYESSEGKERLYCIVTRYEPASKLYLQGAMGMNGCVFGTITFDLDRSGDHATLLKLSHNVIGQIDDETAAGYRDGWRHLLDHDFKTFVETGAEAWSVA